MSAPSDNSVTPLPLQGSEYLGSRADAVTAAAIACIYAGLGVPASLLTNAAERTYCRPDLGRPYPAVDVDDDGHVSYSIPTSVLPPDININPIRTGVALAAEAANAINDFTVQRLRDWPGNHVLLRGDRNGLLSQSPAPVRDEVTNLDQGQIEAVRRLINTGNVQRQMRPEPIVYDAEALDAAAGGVTREMIAMTTRAIQDRMAVGILSQQTGDRFVNRGLLDAVNAGVLPDVAPTDLLTTAPEADRLSRYQQLCELQTITVNSIQRRIGRLPTANEQSELNRVLTKIVFELPDKPPCVPVTHDRVIDI